MKLTHKMMLAGGSFAGGILAGYFISNARQTGHLQEQSKRIEHTVTRMARVLKDSRDRLSDLNNRLKRECKQPIPDLYRATESLSLDEEELIYE